MDINIIAAIGKNRELGYDNKLIWHIKEDLNFFKEMTDGKDILMGKNTFLSLGRVLPNRHHIVISSSLDNRNDIEIFRSLKEFWNKYRDYNDEVYVIGGAKIYSEFIDCADKLYLTEIDSSFVADAFFPEFNKEEYEKIELSSFDEPYSYKHILYKKIIKSHKN